MIKSQRILIMAILCCSGGLIFILPYLREVYYQPMQQAFGFDNTQMGVLMSVFGAFSLLGYFPGGWLADKVSPRRLIASALMTTGLVGIYFATYPSYEMCIAIHAFWGASMSVVFWGALIKTTRGWAGSETQGKAFGILEGGRGVAEILLATGLLGVFALLGAGDSALSTVILLLSAANITLSIVAWFLLSDNAMLEQDENRIALKDVVKVFKMPEVWLIAIIVLSTHSAYWGSFYFTPYASDVFLMGVVMGGAVGVGKKWLQPIAAVVIGVFSDNLGVSRTVALLFLILTMSFTILGLLPVGSAYLTLMLVNVAVVSAAVFGLRGIYFALLAESGIPIAVTGTATGLVSVVGFTPDVFMPLLGGWLLDTYPGGLGYAYMFRFIAGLGTIGIVSAVLIMIRTRKTPNC